MPIPCVQIQADANQLYALATSRQVDRVLELCVRHLDGPFPAGHHDGPDQDLIPHFAELQLHEKLHRLDNGEVNFENFVFGRGSRPGLH